MGWIRYWNEVRVNSNVPGDRAEYSVPIAKIITYTIDKIFEKKLYLLLPFYIFTYEKGFAEYNSNEEKLSELKEAYNDIISRLNALVDRGEMSGFDRRTIMELADDVMQELTRKYENLQKEVGDLMGGAMIITDVHKARAEGWNEGKNEGLIEGRNEGINIGMSQVAENMLRENEPAEKIKTFTGLSIEKLKELAGKLGVNLVL